MSTNSIFYKMLLNVAGTRRVVVTINHKEEKETLTVEPLHYIHILDRSHSMSSNIADLIENVKRTRQIMREGDKLSIIWFAGADQCSVLLKGASAKDDIDALLDTLKSTVGQTCFSTPLREASIVVNDLAALSPYFMVTLFTDGNPVVPWSLEEEEDRIFEALGTLGSKVLAVNTIGYGNYYNQDLLVRIANTSQFGLYKHSSNIDDYESIFGHNFDRVNDLGLGNIAVSSPGKELLYVGNKNVKMQQDSIQLTALSKIRNQVFVVGADDQDFTFEYNGETYNSADITSPKLLPTTLRNFYYAMAFGYYYNGRRELALDILVKELGDKALVDSHMSSFTYEEVSVQSEKLRKAIFKTKYRYKNGVCSEEYIPREDATCVMDILRILAAGDNDYVAPIGKGKKYKRIGAKVIDLYGATSHVDEEAKSPFEDNMILNEKKLNVSLRVRSRVDVTINRHQAERVGLAVIQECTKYRSYAVIRDGHLNQRDIEAIVDKATFDKLTSFGVKMLVVRTEDEPHRAEPRQRVVISFEDVPTINRMYAKSTVQDVFVSLKRITELQTAQKVLNFYLGKTERAVGLAFHQEREFVALTPEQIQVLKDHGINSRKEYNSIYSKKELSGDSYETRILDISLAKFSTLPKVDEVIEKTRKVLNDVDLLEVLLKYEGNYFKLLRDGLNMTPSQALMAAYIEQLQYEASSVGIDFESMDAKQFLRDRLQTVKMDLLQECINLNVLKMGKVLTGAWFDDLESDGKGGYVYHEDGFTLALKTKREVVNI